MKGIFFRSSMGGGLGFETLMIEEKEGVGGGGALVRPKFVPTLTQLHREGLKIGKMVLLLLVQELIFLYKKIISASGKTVRPPQIYCTFFWILRAHCATHHLVCRSLPLAITLHHLKQL